MLRIIKTGYVSSKEQQPPSTSVNLCWYRKTIYFKLFLPSCYQYILWFDTWPLVCLFLSSFFLSSD